MKKKVNLLLIIMAICLLCVCLAACNDGNDDFVGTYFFVGGSMSEHVDMDADVDEESYIRFYKNGTVEYCLVDGSMLSGTYKLDGNKVSVHMDVQDGAALATPSDMYGTVNGDKLLFSSTVEYNGSTVTTELGFRRINMW